MIGIIGKILISLSFVTAMGAAVFYFFSAKNEDQKTFKIGNWFIGLQGLFVLAASVILVYLLFTHQFQYYYVFNYTSLDLPNKYLWSAFYGGQEGSFLLWIFFSWIFSLGIIKWANEPYKAPALFFLTLTQVFLLSMVLGWNFGDLHIGASPFRTIAEEMPNAPFIQANPNFIPADGSGLNDLLKSPWMMIHPPVLFAGFSMMTIPYCFAMAALWKRKYNEWVGPALPWTLAANLALMTAIILGAYWAYVTLSFGGYWAWDPVENAALVPWLFGMAGIHTMIIQRKSAIAQKSSIIFALLAYVGIVYETFLTRSGILSDASVHSFVDLGLYGQLLVFMVVITGLGLGMFVWRFKELPKPEKESKILSREFMTFTGATLLLVLGLVIILGTSSPIIGLLFNERPTPPEMSFYNNWSMPFAILMGLFTVVAQFLFWKKHSTKSLFEALAYPFLVAITATVLSIVFGEVRNFYYMIFLFSGWFAVIGNGWVMFDLIRKKPSLIGGTVTHVGFGTLLIGILASSAFNEPILDKRTADYNKQVKAGLITDEQGFKITDPITMFQLDLNEPTIVNNEYLATYEGYKLDSSVRPGEQTYKIKFESIKGGKSFYLYPQVYPMLANATDDNIQWSVDPDVHSGTVRDIYLYVAGSSYVSQRNASMERKVEEIQTVSDEDTEGEVPQTQTIKFSKGNTVNVDGFEMKFLDYAMEDTTKLPPNTDIGVRAQVEFTHIASGEKYMLEPLFALYNEEGKTFIFAPEVKLNQFDLSFKFTKVYPETGEIDIEITGLAEEYESEWVLVVAEHKPFISVVWLGTFLIMGGFVISIFRHAVREKKG